MLQEQADQLSFGGHDLFPDHHSQIGRCLESGGGHDGAMVGDKNWVKAQALTAFPNPFRLGLRIEGARTVNVEINSDQDGQRLA